MPTGMPTGVPGATTMLTVGGMAAGALQAGDQMEGSSFYDEYTIALSPGQPVTIVVRGGPSASTPGEMVDVKASLRLNGAEVAENDDIDLANNNKNSRIVYAPAAPGMYTLRVSGFGSATGSYNVQVFPGANPNAI
jgi:hypothetical protein